MIVKMFVPRRRSSQGVENTEPVSHCRKQTVGYLDIIGAVLLGEGGNINHAAIGVGI